MRTKNFNVVPVSSSEITPETVYLNRRAFMKAVGVTISGVALAACGINPSASTTTPPADRGSGSQTDELGDSLTSYEDITTYNNYYEFSTGKGQVAALAKNFPTTPWEVQVGGLVHHPKTYGLEDLLKFPQYERIYRLRCVETWAMVIPWVGFELAELLKQAEPMTSASHVRFVTVYNPEQMPGLKDSSYPWPYTEGLHLDEAMHPLTLLATGLYGKSLPPQDGAPIRLVVPWKYGFKSIKSIVKIELVEEQPATFWNTINPKEYGYYSNVNPEVDHPRWSQATEQRVGEEGRRPTLLFNGYAGEVSSLYTGMDLEENY
jgi:sulfoxide reductase catalytic subunit YedY